MAVRPIGHECFCVQRRVVDYLRARVGRRPSSDRGCQAEQQRGGAKSDSRGEIAAGIVPVNEGPHNVHVVDGMELECNPEMNKIENRTVAKFEFGCLHGSVCASRNVARTRLDCEQRSCWRGRSTRVAPQFPWGRGLPEARQCAATASRRRACPSLAAAASRS